MILFSREAVVNRIGGRPPWGRKTMVEFAEQRLNMVESQVRPSDLTDRRITTGMLAVAREAYLPADLQSVAYSDGELSLDGIDGAKAGRSALAPRTVAQMLQLLELDAQDIVLLVGAGAGYEAALLSSIVQTVVGIEADPALAKWAETALQNQDIGNAAIVESALELGYAGEGPYDAILINGGVDDVPDGLLDQLKDGGRLVAVRRSQDLTRLVRWQRIGEQYSQTEYAVVAAPVLPAFARKPAFVF